MANLGMGHPTYNPEGAAKASDDKKWFETTIAFNSKADCFDSSKLLTNSGTIASGKSGHKAGKYADAIYASSVQDLRMSSKKLPLKEIREKYKRMAIAGEVRGFEGVPFIKPIGGYLSEDIQVRWVNGVLDVYLQGGAVTDIPNYGTSKQFTLGKKYTFAIYKTGAVYRFTGYYKSYSVGAGHTFIDTNNPDGFVNSAYYSSIGDQAFAVLMPSDQTHHQANPTWTDIIGSPENIAATFPDGVEGQWNPDFVIGTSGRAFNRKRTIVGNVAGFYASPDGGSWGTTNFSVNSTLNEATISLTSNDLVLLHYETQAHFTSDDVNSEVLDLGGVFAVDAAYASNGNVLLSSLIGKVGKVTSSKKHTDEVPINRSYIDSTTRKLYTDSNYLLSHIDIDLDILNDSPVTKTLDYLSSKNGIAKLCYAYKEMKFDVTWGDNNKFEIYNQSAVITDDNGNSIKVGTASFDTQYFISEE